MRPSTRTVESIARTAFAHSKPVQTWDQTPDEVRARWRGAARKAIEDAHGSGPELLKLPGWFPRQRAIWMRWLQGFIAGAVVGAGAAAALL